MITFCCAQLHRVLAFVFRDCASLSSARLPGARRSSTLLRRGLLRRTASLSAAMRRRIFLLLALPLLLLTALPAQAINYTFPGALPAGCVDNGGGSYTCGAISLGASDTIAITSATTITVNGAFDVAAGGQINSGAPFSLNITTVGAAFGAGANVILNANVISGAALTIGADAQVGGNLKTDVGDIKIGANTTIVGDLSVGTGAILLGANDTVNGSISVTGTGAITIGASSQVNGNISAVTGAITLGAHTSATGNISTVDGAVTLGANIDVYGNISTVNGAITVGAAGAVGGSISITGTGAVSVGAHSNIGGTISAANGAITTGAGTVSGTAIGNFECLETGSNIPWSPTTRRPLYTKLAGTGFSIDIAALKTDGTPQTSYASKYVKVELFEDTTPLTNCPDFAGKTPVVTQTVVFASNAAGRTTTGIFNLNSAYKILRCRVTECTDSTCGHVTAAPPACSSDQFSVRPASFAATVTKADGSALGSTIKAGVDDIKATVSVTTAGYSGSAFIYPSASVDHNHISVLNRNTLTMADAGNTPMTDGTVSFNVASGAPANGNFRYHDAGTLTLAIRDKTYTGVDQSNNDCMVGSASNVLTNGKYGCEIGVDQLISRFIPDHFTVSGSFTPSCSGGGFTYMDDPRLGINFKVSAESSREITATQYANPCPTSGSCKLTLTAQNSSTQIDISRLTPLASFPGATTVGSGAASTYESTTWSNGVYTVSGTALKYARDTTPDGAYDNFKLKAAIADPDGVAIAAQGTSDETKIRYGRIALSNAHGSERLALPIPMKVQYYKAGAGWLTASQPPNTADSCTPIALPASIGFTFATLTTKNHLAASNVKAYLKNAGTYITSGIVTRDQLSLASPGNSAVGPGIGYVDVYFDLAVMPWLNFNWKGKPTPTAADLNPTARATFGVYKSEFIYLREMY
ncbi:MAG: hypothetical protein HHJ09_08605 [Glaciimonas sp.]|nr:hypothetical protein [Glaciimonas sp.]